MNVQKDGMKAFDECEDHEIVVEYEDAGKFGKSIDGRSEFKCIMEDIKSAEYGVAYVFDS